MEIFELVETTPEQVIIKVNAKDPLTVAKHPYVQSNYEYITVTRGKNHILTIIRNDGTTFNFHWGDSGHTLISDSLERLRTKVVDFIETQNILFECNFDKADNVRLFYNNNFKRWQLSLCKNGKTESYHWFHDLTTNDETSRLKAIERAKKFGVCQFVRTTCSTGIPIWKSLGNC